MFGWLKRKTAPPKTSLDDFDLDLKQIPGAVDLLDDFPRVHWDVVRAAVARYDSHPHVEALWTELAAQWLGVLRRHLGGDYRLYEHGAFLLLSAQDPRAATDLLKLANAAHQQLSNLVKPANSPRSLGKHPVLVFRTQEEFYDYVHFFYPDSDEIYGAAAGVHLSDGYRHIAINAAFHSEARVLVHELAHEIVHDRPLPNWLNEGLAQWAEDIVPGYRMPIITARQARLHRRFWKRTGLQRFWTGESFHLARTQELSYQLSQVLFRNLLSHPTRSSQVAKFLETADRADAGEAAAKACFGCNLAQLAAEFFGPCE